MKTSAENGCREHPWLKKLCLALPLVALVGLVASWVWGFPFGIAPFVALLILCPLICLALLVLSRDVGRQISASVDANQTPGRQAGM